MRETPMPSPAVVVGVDSSRAAINAALWAVDEAVSRDIPMRLLHAIEPRSEPLSAEQAARDLAFAEIAVRGVFMAVESLERPVKVEVQIVQDRAGRALVKASHSATMVCMGGLGVGRSTGRHYGSTAAAVSRSANCPVAIVQRNPTGGPGWILAEVDDSVEDARVLETAVEEAVLRRCPLRVVTAWRPHFTDVHDGPGAGGTARSARAHLDKQLAWWRRRYPELEIESVSGRGGAMGYLARHADSILLFVVAHGWPRGGGASDSQAHAALRDTKNSVLICSRYSAL